MSLRDLLKKPEAFVLRGEQSHNIVQYEGSGKYTITLPLKDIRVNYQDHLHGLEHSVESSYLTFAIDANIDAVSKAIKVIHPAFAAKPDEYIRSRVNYADRTSFFDADDYDDLGRD